MDPTGFRMFMGSAGGIVLPAIGDSFQGGFYAGLISHTANGVATHALIVAPRATGASGTGYALPTYYPLKTTDTVTTGTTSAFDGAANTTAMVTAGIASHPAAQFCVNLNINGYSDWYLPARYELEIAYFHLKPTTYSNHTASGINSYSVPARTANYTAGYPAQTSVTDFKDTGSEDFLPEYHRSSTESNGIYTWTSSFREGSQSLSLKTSTWRVRAFRKIAL